MPGLPPAPVPSDHDNISPGLIFILAFFGFFATASTVLRLIVRGASRLIWWDDITITAALILQLVNIIFIVFEIHNGLGQHRYFLSDDEYTNAIMWGWMTQPLLFVILCLTKISICLFILRIRNTGWLRWFLWGLMIGLVVTTIPPLVVLFAECHPIQATWDKRINGKCWKVDIYFDIIWLQVAYSILSDLACSLLPIAVLWKVQISRKLKTAICALMSLGLLATIAGIVRAKYSNSADTNDQSFTRTYIIDWANVEVHLGITCANLVLSRSVYKFFKSGGAPKDRPSRYQFSTTDRGPSKNSKPSKKNTLMETEMGDDGIPLHSGSITKTLEVNMTHDGASTMRTNSHDEDEDLERGQIGRAITHPGQAKISTHAISS